MNRLTILLLSLAGLVVLLVGLRSALKLGAPAESTKAETTNGAKVDQRILRARQAIEQAPNKSEGYNQLASAYMQKARETADFAFTASADAAITRSLEVEPENYNALKLRAKLQLTYHRFREALETARRAQKVRDDDHDVWGQIADAYVELGDYPLAVQAAQRMIDLRPDSSAYARVAYLRSLHGDIDGAVQAMKLAVKAADPNDPEAMAWCRLQLGNELMNAGKLAGAEQEFDLALRIFPNHHLAWEGKARARIAAGDLGSAVKIYQREESSADAALALGELYTIFGRKDEARKQYEKVESLERENAELEKSWRHMINYWLDHNLNLKESLTLVSREYEARKDIFTCDSYAWALFKNGRVADAKRMIDEALRLRTRDARINYHAGLIYKALNLRNRAVQHLELAAALNSAFDPIQVRSAREMLAKLN
jgi:tetratricopeptide (TPR) repeat protein